MKSYLITAFIDERPLLIGDNNNPGVVIKASNWPAAIAKGSRVAKLHIKKGKRIQMACIKARILY